MLTISCSNLQGTKLLPGAKELVDFLHKNNKKFLFLTNNSAPTPRELQQKLGRLGIDVTEDHFFTAGQATAEFLKSQMPEGGTCYVIGEPGLAYALYEKGFFMNDHNPDYVVLGEGSSYNYERLTKAVQLVGQGAKLIATNLDVENLDSKGNKIPSCGAFAACVEVITKTKAFFCGKPSALIMRYAQRTLGLSRSETCIIGDRMDTDVAAGISSEIDPVLVLSGVTAMEDLAQFAYRPYVILGGVYEIPNDDEKHNITESEMEDAARRVSRENQFISGIDCSHKQLNRHPSCKVLHVDDASCCHTLYHISSSSSFSLAQVSKFLILLLVPFYAFYQ